MMLTFFIRIDKYFDMDEWIEHRLIKSKSLERREYQVNIAGVAVKKNILVVLPTGLGKTAIALLIVADMLERGKRCIIFAPTRVLVNQHYHFFKEHLNIDEVEVVTGSMSRAERMDVWSNARVVCSTPQIALNDIDRGILVIDDFGLLVFDEAHRAVGEYAYTKIASLSNARIVGFTATLPDDKDRIMSIVDALKIERVEVRSEESLDVRAYVKDTKVEFVEVELNELFKGIRSRVLDALNSRLDSLRTYGVIDSTKVGVGYLIRIRDEMQKGYGIGMDKSNTSNKDITKILYSAIRVSHALRVLDTQGLVTFTRFYERLIGKRGIGMKELIRDLKEAYEMARGAIISGIEHPKMDKLVEVLRPFMNGGGRVIIFSSYRDSVETIQERLRSEGFNVGYLIGKSVDSTGRGLRQDEQIDALEKFRSGEYNILVATNVGEEGLDVAECNLVIFYDNVPSAIRFIQRKGRTGRRISGRVIVLVTKDTIDEAYYWISKRKVKRVGMVAEMINSMLARKGLGLGSESDKYKYKGNVNDSTQRLDNFILKD